MMIDGVFWLQPNNWEALSPLPLIIDYPNKKKSLSSSPNHRQVNLSFKVAECWESYPLLQFCIPVVGIFFFLNIVVSYDWLHVKNWKCQKVVNSDTASLESLALLILFYLTTEVLGVPMSSQDYSLFSCIWQWRKNDAQAPAASSLFLSSNKLLYFFIFPHDNTQFG